MTTRKVGELSPEVSPDAYVDEDARVIGGVVLEEGVSVWPFALIRADDDRVTVRRGSAIMDTAFIEAPEGRPVTVGTGCIISHGARLHGCTIGDGVLVGIGATVLDGADVGPGSVIAAGSLVPPGARVEPGSLVVGIPARRARDVTDEDADKLRMELTGLREKARRYNSDQQHL